MNLFIISIICLIFFILNYIKTRNLISPASFFNTIWGISTFIAYNNINGLFPVSGNTCFIIFLGVISFNISSILLSKKKSKNLIIDISSRLNTSVIIIIQIIILVTFLPFFFRSMNILQNSTLSEVRNISFIVDGNIFKNIYELIYVRYIVEPFFIAMIIVTIYDIFFSEKINLLMLIIEIISLLFESSAFGSRLSSFRFIIIFIIIFMIYNNKKINVNKHRLIRYLIIIFMISVFLISIFQITILRQNKSLISVFVDYITSQFTFMDIIINKYQFYFTNTNGLMFIGGLYDTIIIFINKIFSTKVHLVSDIYAQFTGDSQIVGRNSYYNAFSTMFFSFYLDGGYIAVCIESFLFGIISSLSYNAINKKVTFLTLSIYSLIAYIIIFSILRWEFMISWTWITIIIISLISLLIKNQKLTSLCNTN